MLTNMLWPKLSAGDSFTMPQGFLAVSSHPSSRLPIEEFHEWYEEEHIPLRLNHLKEFLSGARYVSCQENEDRSVNDASWLALYTVVSSVVFSSSSYQDLRINRSDRERDVMNRIEVLTRITGEIIGTYLSGPGEEKTTGFKPGRPSGCIVTHGINTRDVDKESEGDIINSWVSQVKLKVAKYRDIEEGWARTLLVLVLESGVSRFGKNAEADDKNRMPYFVVHGGLIQTFIVTDTEKCPEFKDRESAQGFSKQILEVADAGIEIGERTIWELFKAYPCLAHNAGK